MKVFLRLCIAPVLLLFLNACGSGGVEYTPLTESQTLMFSDSIKEAIDFYDFRFFLGHQDKSRLRNRTEALGEEARRPGNVSGIFLDQFDLADGVLLGDPMQGTHWTYVYQNRIMVQQAADSLSLIQIRVHDLEFGHEYYTFLAEVRTSSRNKKVVISDYFVYSTGEWISETAYELAALDAVMAELPLPEQERINGAIEMAIEMVEAREYVSADSIMGTLPSEVRKRKGPARLWLDAAMNLGERDFDRALENYKDNFPTDPTPATRTFERHFGLGHYQAAMASLDEMEESLGGTDAYLQNVRGEVWSRMEAPDSADICFRLAIKLEPEFPLPYLSLFYLDLEKKDYEDAVKVLVSLNEFGYTLENLDLAKHPGFLNSEAFQNYVGASELFPGDEDEVEEKGSA